ncbi:DUF2326 domain-containing protein [Nesterenkonia aurantiaca]|uniref:DUF2326 domain-containing protein n=1 Tax=Nesterenkonia aurantiaca TaxID=1436010 RepID=UPI003EE78438
MKLRRLSSSLDTFRDIEFKDGLNLLLADKSARRSRETRNGTGKTSVIHLLRYLLGGEQLDELKSPTLEGVTFSLDVDSAKFDDGSIVRIMRTVGQPGITLRRSNGVDFEYSLKDWNSVLAKDVFQLPQGILRPTLPQLRAQSLRTSFDPVKMNQSEAEWEAGARIGFLLGMDPAAFAEGARVARLKQQQKALNQATKDGIFSSVGGDVAEIEADLATSRRRKQQIEKQLHDFTVDEQYREHQELANRLSQRIRSLNDSSLALGSRAESLEAALDEASSSLEERGAEFVATMFEEAGALLPELIVRRFDEVARFHESVLENRRTHLAGEIEGCRRELRGVEEQRAQLDAERSRILKLLEASMALESYQSLIIAAGDIESKIVDAERRIEFMGSITGISDDIKIATITAKQHISEALSDSSDQVDFARARFVELAEEIYGPTSSGESRAALKIGASPKAGHLKVEPVIRSDNSSGIKSVQTFLLDQVLVEAASNSARWCGFLMHDSELFDGVDSEQIADCLNIGARIAEDRGVQYIVSMNSDTLRQAVFESEEGFDPQKYTLPVILSDTKEADRLFGVQLDDWKRK